MTDERKEIKKTFKELVSEHKTEIMILTGIVATGVFGYLGYKYIPKLSQSSVKEIPSFPEVKQLADTVKGNSELIIEKKTPRYLVEFKAFKTGNWYPKTRTDYINSAYSVASCNNYGRAYRIIDTETGDILKEVLEDASMARCNGYPW